MCALAISPSIVSRLFPLWLETKTGTAPVIQEINIEFNVVHFNGSLFKKNAFRYDAGPEVDEAWESLGVDCESLWLLLVPADVERSIGHCAC